MIRKQRLLFCILLVLAIFSSVLFVALETNHDCSGEDCPICLCLNVCEGTLKYLSLAIRVVVAALLVNCALPAFHINETKNFTILTPVALKIKLSN